MKLHFILTRTLLAGAMLTLATMASQAAIISWGSAQNITGNSDVSTSGTLVDAFNIGPTSVASTVVNGVNFASWGYATASTPSVTLGNYTFAASSGNIGSASSFGSGVAPFSALSAPYGALLSSGGGASSGATATLTMSGLTVGQTYQFEWWSNDSSSAVNSTTATAGNSVFLDSNIGNVGGSLGQFAIGSFTADAVSQQIAVSRGVGASVSIVNGFQLRATPVPEPTTALFGLALVGFCTTARRRSRAR